MGGASLTWFGVWLDRSWCSLCGLRVRYSVFAGVDPILRARMRVKRENKRLWNWQEMAMEYSARRSLEIFEFCFMKVLRKVR